MTLGPNKRLVSIYKSRKKDEMYLYVDKKEGTSKAPEALLSVFGNPEFVFDLLLTPEKKLARAQAGEVLENIQENGYYLQMPPVTDEQELAVVQAKEQSPIKGRSLE